MVDRDAEAPRNGARGIALALSGGGARSIAHVGALRVLEREGIPIRRVSGTSGGGLIAVLVAAGYPLLDLERDARSLEWRRLADLRPHALGLMTAEKLGHFVARRIGELDFAGLKIPCAVVATDLTSGGRRVFDRGPVIPAVQATCAVPEFYRPVEIDGHLYVDGGVVEPLPLEALRALGSREALPRVGVDVLRRGAMREPPRTPWQLLGRITDIVQLELARLASSSADLIVAPDVGGFSLFSLERSEDLLAAGAAAMEARLPQLRALLAAGPPARNG